MKNQLQLTIAIIISIMINPINSSAQDELSTPSGYFWVGLDYGGSSITAQERNLLGKSFHLNLNYNKGFHLFSFQVGLSNYEKKIAGGRYYGLDEIFGGGSGTKIPDQFLKSSFTQVNLIYGLISSPSTMRIFAATGLSWVKAHDYISNASYDKNEISGIGLPIKVGTILSLGNIGLGINYSNNINSYSNSSGVSVSFMIGVMK